MLGSAWSGQERPLENAENSARSIFGANPEPRPGQLGNSVVGAASPPRFLALCPPAGLTAASAWAPNQRIPQTGGSHGRRSPPRSRTKLSVRRAALRRPLCPARRRPPSALSSHGLSVCGEPGGGGGGGLRVPLPSSRVPSPTGLPSQTLTSSPYVLKIQLHIQPHGGRLPCVNLGGHSLAQTKGSGLGRSHAAGAALPPGGLLLGLPSPLA